MKVPLLILAVILIGGCSDKPAKSEKTNLLVFTSILPQTGLLKTIAGKRVEVIPLVGEGQSPHSYEPTAKQLARLGKADALMTIGVPFETRLLKKIESLYPDLAIIKTQKGILQRNMPHEHGKHCDDDHGTKDPHVWLAPLEAIKIAENIYNTLIELDAEHAPYYQKNYNVLVDDLMTLQAEIQSKLEPFKGSRFYVFHPSFGYFSDAYGLEQIPIELDGKSPSPRQMADLIDQAKKDKVKIIFVSKQFPVSSANAVANAISGSVVQLDPLAEDVVANLRKIADSVLQALKP